MEELVGQIHTGNSTLWGVLLTDTFAVVVKAAIAVIQLMVALDALTHSLTVP